MRSAMLSLQPGSPDPVTLFREASAFVLDTSRVPPAHVRQLSDAALAHGAAVIMLAPLSGNRSKDQYIPATGSRVVKVSKPLKRRDFLRGIADAMRMPQLAVAAQPASAFAPLTPVHPIPAPPVIGTTPRAVKPAPESGGNSFASQHPARILLVEDVPLNQKISTMLLQRLGYSQVDIANNGREAVDMVNAGSYDIVFMDLQMPVMGGVEATREIRGNFLLKQQPAIIAMTGHALTGVKESCMEAGMNHFLTKPVSLDDFRNTIPECLERAHQVTTLAGVASA
jgi:CheY-like chemotaxis protein